MTSLLKDIDLGQPWLIASVGTVLFNPIFWNIVARNEYQNKSLTKIFGSPYNGTVFLAITIFSLGIFRDWVYHKALLSQPTYSGFSNILVKAVGAGLVIVGQVLVVTSIWALGLTGTYLGDYFGILMSHRVTSFPFNIMRDPMYNGSTLCFIGTALFYAKPAGLAVSVLVYVVYQVALAFEGPFTDKIYSSAAAKKKREAVPVSASSGSDVGASSAGKTRTQSSTATATATKSQPQQQTQQSTSTSSATATGSSYASAVNDHSHESRSTLPSTDPRPQVDLSHLGLGNPITNGYVGTGDPKAGAFAGLPEGSSPARVTRSRSRARIVDDD